jgi:hypothetical protein
VGIDVLAAALSSGTLLSSLYVSVRAWLGRRRDTSVTITHGDKTIEINLEKPEQAELFIKDFLARYSADKRETADD